MDTLTHKKYELDSRRCRLEIGDLVGPDTIIGIDHATGELVRAGLRGHVASVYFNPMHDSLMVLAISASDN